MASTNFSSSSVVVFGPQGCGKTRHAEHIARKLGLHRIVEVDQGPYPLDWDGDGVLYLTNRSEEAARRIFPPEAILVHFDQVAISVGLSAPVKESNPKEAVGDTKVPLWLCSAIAMAHWASAQVAGLFKYGAWNWRAAGVRASTYISAMKRHLGRWENGERLDPVDGTHHLGNIMACCAILLEAEAIGKLNDDRPPAATEALLKAFDEVEAITARLREQYKDRNPRHYTIADEIKP